MKARRVELLRPRLLATRRDVVWLATDTEAFALAATGEVTRRIEGTFEGAALLPDGTLLGLGRDGTEVYVVDFATDEELFEVTTIFHAQVGKLMLAWGQDETSPGQVEARIHGLPEGEVLGAIALSSTKPNVFAATETSLFAFTRGSSSFQMWSLPDARGRTVKHPSTRFVGPAAVLGDELAIVASVGAKGSAKEVLAVLDTATGELRRHLDLDAGTEVSEVFALDGRFAVLTEAALLREEGTRLAVRVAGARTTYLQEGRSWAAYFGEEGGIVLPLPELCFGARGAAPRVLTPRNRADFAVTEDALFLLHAECVDVIPWEALAEDGPVLAERVATPGPRPPPTKATVLGASGNLLRVETAEHPLLEIIIAHAPGSGEGPLGLARGATVDLVIGERGLVDELRFTKGEAASRYTRADDRLEPASGVVEIGVAAPLRELRPAVMPPELERLVELGVLARAALQGRDWRSVAVQVSAAPEAERLAAALRGATDLPTARGVSLANGAVDEPQVLARDIARALPKGARLRLRIDDEVSALTIALEHGAKKVERVVELGAEPVADALDACFEEAGIDVGVLALAPETDILQLLVAPKRIVGAVRIALGESPHV